MNFREQIKLGNLPTLSGEMPGIIQLEEPMERVFFNSRHLRSGPAADRPQGRMKTVQLVTVDQLLSHVDRLWQMVSTFLFCHIFVHHFSIFFGVFVARLARSG